MGTYPPNRDSCGKLQLIPDDVSGPKGVIPPEEGPTSYQLVGEVMAHQGYDGYGV